MGTFEVFDHTADVGFLFRAMSLPDLLETAARAVFGVMLLDMPQEVVRQEKVEVTCEASVADDLGELLVDWLQELLFRFETGRWAPIRFAFEEARAGRAVAQVGFGLFDPKRHRTGPEVKAVTYHQLSVRHEADGTWSARLIIDI